jgi:hypothetical protein
LAFIGLWITPAGKPVGVLHFLDEKKTLTHLAKRSFFSQRTHVDIQWTDDSVCRGSDLESRAGLRRRHLHRDI